MRRPASARTGCASSPRSASRRRPASRSPPPPPPPSPPPSPRAPKGALGRRLKLANHERERVVALVAHHMFWYSAEWSGATVRRFMGRVGVELLPDLFALRAGDVRARGRGEEPGVEIDELKQRIDAEV